MAPLSLRTRILLITVIPIVTLVFATLAIVNRTITSQVSDGIHDDLVRASAVAQNVLEARARMLAVAGGIIARDPKFFSVLTIPGSHLDPQLCATVAGVARDFNLPGQTDLFEVMDGKGRLLASVGPEASDPRARAGLVAQALGGRATAGILTGKLEDARHYQAQVVPVAVGGRIVGVLLLGERIDDGFARDLRELTRSQVTFVSGATITGTTLGQDEDRGAVLEALTSPAVGRAGGLGLFHDPFVAFGFIAACTNKVELSTQVLILAQRQTVLVAKQAASLDVLSGGRFRFGIGVGWNGMEFVGLNENFHNRGKRSEEQVQVMKALWANP